MEQTKKLNMTSMSEKTNSNTTTKKEEPAWEHNHIADRMRKHL